MELCGTACDPVKFLDRQLQGTVFVRMTPKQRSEAADWKDCLHRTFSKCVLVPDDHRAPIVLERSCENLAGGRALPAGQNNQRPGVSDAWIRVGRDPDAPIII